MKTAFTSRQASAITGLTQRQLAYWRKSGLISPSQHSPGGHARYTFIDLVALRTAKRLLESGSSVQKIRKSVASLLAFLPGQECPLTELSLLAIGETILVFHQDAAFDTLSGQTWMLPLAQIQREIERLHYPDAETAPRQQDLFPESAGKNTERAFRRR